MGFPTYDFARSPSVWSFGGLWSEVAGSSQPPVWSWPRKKILLTLALNCISTLSYRFRLKWATTKNTGRVFFAVDTYSNLGAGLNNIDTFVFGWMLGNYERRTCKKHLRFIVLLLHGRIAMLCCKYPVQKDISLLLSEISLKLITRSICFINFFI